MLTCSTHSYTPCSIQDAFRLHSGVRGQLSVSSRPFKVLSSLCRDILSIGPCSIQDAMRLHFGVMHNFPSILFRVTSDAHCHCCGVLEETPLPHRHYRPTAVRRPPAGRRPRGPMRSSAYFVRATCNADTRADRIESVSLSLPREAARQRYVG